MSGMKSATVKKFLRSQVNKWLATITDERVRGLCEKDTIVSGGAIASLMMGEKLNDYDIYFRTRDTARSVAVYYVDTFNKTNAALKLKSYVKSSVNPEVKDQSIENIRGDTEERIIIYMKSSGVASATQEEYGYFESESEATTDAFVDSLNKQELGEELSETLKSNPKYAPIFFSDNAISLSDKFQLVIRFYGEPKEIHDNYDYAHAMCSYDYGKDELNLHPEALEAMLSKTLIYKGSLYPIASLFRIRKFVARGWRISAGQMLKIIFQLNGVDLNNPTILREQLIGVDQAYMSQLLSVLQNRNHAEKIDSLYITKIIDEIFE